MFALHSVGTPSPLSVEGYHPSPEVFLAFWLVELQG